MVDTGNPVILIVEDSPPMITILKEIFKTNVRNCTILEATDGITAVKKYKEYKPDLVTIIANNLKYLGYERTLAVSRLNDIPKKVLNVLGTH